MTDNLNDIVSGAFQATINTPRDPSQQEIAVELVRCTADPVYFINRYIKIFDNETKGWIPFTLWNFQADTLRDITAVDDMGDLIFRRIVALKTRQIGFTWLFGVAHKMWKMLFLAPLITEVLVFSQSDEDAMAVLSEQRFRGTYKLIPDWMKDALHVSVTVDSAHEFRLSNGCGIRALPESRGGDSRTVTDVFIDEADLITDLDNLLARAKPTLGSKGQLIVNGRAVKEKPGSAFKRLYNQAKKGEGEWNKAIFVPWYAHPLRRVKLKGPPEQEVINLAAKFNITLEQAQWKYDEDTGVFNRTGTLDSSNEHYPSTDAEALSARSLDKRFAPAHISALYKELAPLPPRKDTPTLPALKIFAYPEQGRKYGIGADPAGGMSDGDDAVAFVVDSETKLEVAVMAGKIEPTTFGDNVADLSLYYNSAPIEFELNNHGHAVRAKLKERGASLRPGMTRNGPSRNPGWLTTEWSKKLLYDTAAAVVQDIMLEAVESGNAPVPIIFDFNTASQLASIDASGLSAPEGEHDDYSVAWALAQMCVHVGVPSMSQVPYKGLYGDKSDSRDHFAPPDARQISPAWQPLSQADTIPETPLPDEVQLPMSNEEWLAKQQARRYCG